MSAVLGLVLCGAVQGFSNGRLWALVTTTGTTTKAYPLPPLSLED